MLIFDAGVSHDFHILISVLFLQIPVFAVRNSEVIWLRELKKIAHKVGLLGNFFA